MLMGAVLTLAPAILRGGHWQSRAAGSDEPENVARSVELMRLNMWAHGRSTAMTWRDGADSLHYAAAIRAIKRAIPAPPSRTDAGFQGVMRDVHNGARVGIGCVRRRTWRPSGA